MEGQALDLTDLIGGVLDPLESNTSPIEQDTHHNVR